MLRRGKIKLKKKYWVKGKSKYLLPRAYQEGLIKFSEDMWTKTDDIYNRLHKKLNKKLKV